MVAINDNGFIPEGSDIQGYFPSRDRKLYPLENPVVQKALEGSKPKKVIVVPGRIVNVVV